MATPQGRRLGATHPSTYFASFAEGLARGHGPAACTGPAAGSPRRATGAAVREIPKACRPAAAPARTGILGETRTSYNLGRPQPDTSKLGVAAGGRTEIVGEAGGPGQP